MEKELSNTELAILKPVLKMVKKKIEKNESKINSLVSSQLKDESGEIVFVIKQENSQVYGQKQRVDSSGILGASIGERIKLTEFINDLIRSFI